MKCKQCKVTRHNKFLPNHFITAEARFIVDTSVATVARAFNDNWIAQLRDTELLEVCKL